MIYEMISIQIDYKKAGLTHAGKNGIPCELHVFERGRHGLALASAETDTPDGATHEEECTVWPELFYNWLLK